MKENRIGEEKMNNQGYKMKIIDYKTNMNITVQFEDGYVVKETTYNNFKKGEIRNPYYPTVYNIGIIGDEEKVSKDGILLDSYKSWFNMFRRCYDTKFLKREPSYIRCEVSKEWIYYKNFKIWYNENFYKVDDEEMNLDKDILMKGNKIYSPNTCIFVPKKINAIFTKRDYPNKSLPIGVYMNGNRYAARMYFNGKQKFLGNFNTIDEAFNCYKENKETYIKEIAEEYKNKIPMKLYKAMINYKVEIND